MQDVDLGWMTQRLVNNAISFRQAKQRSELLLGSIGIQIKIQANLPEADRHVLGYTKRTTKVEIALRANCRATEWNAQSRGDCAQCDARASYQRFQQHVRRTRALSIASGRGVKPGFDARFSGFDFAGNIFGDSTLRVQGNERGFRALAILRFQRRLQCP